MTEPAPRKAAAIGLRATAAKSRISPMTGNVCLYGSGTFVFCLFSLTGLNVPPASVLLKTPEESGAGVQNHDCGSYVDATA